MTTVVNTATLSLLLFREGWESQLRESLQLSFGALVDLLAYRTMRPLVRPPRPHLVYSVVQLASGQRGPLLSLAVGRSISSGLLTPESSQPISR